MNHEIIFKLIDLIPGFFDRSYIFYSYAIEYMFWRYYRTIEEGFDFL
jgi:hypothetical protein